MAGFRKRKPQFWWQAALILMPVIVLAVVGLYSLRQDRLLVEREAQERAQQVANDLLPRFRAVFTEVLARNGGLLFRVGESGALLSPQDFVPVPEPQPLNPGELSAEQATLWLKAQTSDGRQAERCYSDFLSSNPPERFAAFAGMDLSALIAERGNVSEALGILAGLAERHDGLFGESGIPIRPLIEFRRFELALKDGRNPDPHQVDILCSNLIDHPTMLTSYLLARLEEHCGKAESGRAARERLAHWNEQWRQDELSRRLFRAIRSELQKQALVAQFKPRLAESGVDPGNTPTLIGRSRDSLGPAEKEFIWIHLPEGAEIAAIDPPTIQGNREPTSGELTEWNWLAASEEEDGGVRRFQCLSDLELSRLMRHALRADPIPDYLAIDLRIAGRQLTAFAPDLRLWEYVRQGGKEGSTRKEFSEKTASDPLATAKADMGPLQVGVYLTSPAEIFRRQMARTFWFTTLVLVSAVAALIGLAAAWRVFREQERLNEMKSNFVSSVSHELRAPIASVRLMAESLERGKVSEPEKQNEYFRFIGQECRRLSALIENVLDFARIEQDRKEYEFESTDLNALARETVKLMEPYAAERGVRLEVEATFNVQRSTFNFEVEVDGRAVQQALVNLIDNAIKHSPKGEVVVIGLSFEESDVNGAQPSAVRISVTDRGPGIPPDEHEKIFERFYRRGSELRRETPGVGIGLSIVRHVAEAHGGRVRVESTPGQGSRFIITLPHKQSAPRTPKQKV